MPWAVFISNFCSTNFVVILIFPNQKHPASCYELQFCRQILGIAMYLKNFQQQTHKSILRFLGENAPFRQNEAFKICMLPKDVSTLA